MTYHEGIEACFPDYFSRFTLPPQARPQELFVYRACSTGKLERGSFLDSFEAEGFAVHPGLPEDSPTAYSLSVYLDLVDVKRFCSKDGKMDPPWPVGLGYTYGCCGPCCLTSEWKNGEASAQGAAFKNKKKMSSHVDWWLYKDARPWEHFEVTDYEAEYKRISQGTEGAGTAGAGV